ncbi:MAG: hypothetical protein JWN27_587 [Candidatus Eremiobacteraeota bacterium]|nr:hypothetical protein [Candidatus Eremiobacteraeota bacterium]
MAGLRLGKLLRRGPAHVEGHGGRTRCRRHEEPATSFDQSLDDYRGCARVTPKATEQSGRRDSATRLPRSERRVLATAELQPAALRDDAREGRAGVGASLRRSYLPRHPAHLRDASSARRGVDYPGISASRALDGENHARLLRALRSARRGSSRRAVRPTSPACHRVPDRVPRPKDESPLKNAKTPSNVVLTGLSGNVPRARIELATPGFSDLCSTD